MNRPLTIMAVVLVLAAGALPQPLFGAQQPVLRILNWEDYLDPELAVEFGRRHGVTIRETFFASDTERDRRLAGGGAAGFDLVIVDRAQLPVYRDRGWIAPLDTARIPGLRHYDARWRRAADGSATHGMPFAWGTVGIAYRADLLDRPPATWLALFRPTPELCGKVLVLDDTRELVATALKSLGESANAAEPGAYQRAAQLLKAQSPCVARYGTTGVDADSELVTGEAWAAMAYNSDVVWLRKVDPNIRFVLPQEGGLIWVDYLAVLSASKQKALATAFLEFLSEPAIAARQAAFSKAATPNLAARAYLSVVEGRDRTIYPSGPAFDASETVVAAPPAIVAIRNQIHAKLVRKQ